MSAPANKVDYGPIDPLRALTAIANYQQRNGAPRRHPAMLRDVHAAVAELVEADREYDKARRAWDDGTYSEWEGISDRTRMKVAADFEAALVRRVNALARFGGAT